MPILDPADPVLRHLPQSVERALPTFDELAGPGLGSEAMDRTIWRELSGQSFQSSGQIVFAGIGMRLGFAQDAAFREVLSFLGKNAVTELVISQAQAAVFAAFEEAIEAGVGRAMTAVCQSVLQNIPYVGIVVKAVWEVATLLYRVAQLARARDEAAKAVYQPSKFDGATDADWFDGVLAPMVRDTIDWTLAFSPPGYAADQVEGYIKTARLEGDGLAIMPGALTQNALGIVPGNAWLHRSIELFRVGKSRNGAGLWVSEPGQFLPTVKNHGTWLWAHVLEPGPAMYCVDASTAKDRWHAYLWNLREWIRKTGDLSDEQKRIIVDAPAWSRETGKPLTQWMGFREVFGWAPFDTPYDERRPFGNYWLDDHGKQCVPVGAMDRLWARQRDVLETPVCAYVSKDHAGIRTQRTLRGRWEQGRRNLLESPDVMSVDATMVPDLEFRSEVETRQAAGVKGGLSLGAGRVMKPTRVAPHPGVAGVGGINVVGAVNGQTLHLPPEPSPPAAPPVDGKTALGAVLGLLGLGIAGAGGWYWIKRRRERAA